MPNEAVRVGDMMFLAELLCVYELFYALQNAPTAEKIEMILKKSSRATIQNEALFERAIAKSLQFVSKDDRWHVETQVRVANDEKSGLWHSAA